MIKNFHRKIALENVDIKALSSTRSVNYENHQIRGTLIIINKLLKIFFKSLTSRLSDYSSSKFEITDENKKSAIIQL